MGTPLLGWIVIVFGVFFLLLGLAAAVKKVINEYSFDNQSEGVSIDIGTIQVLTALISALVNAPLWLALTGIGIVLIILGSSWAF